VSEVELRGVIIDCVDADDPAACAAGGVDDRRKGVDEQRLAESLAAEARVEIKAWRAGSRRSARASWRTRAGGSSRARTHL
jgi:hypothetical protein